MKMNIPSIEEMVEATERVITTPYKITANSMNMLVSCVYLLMTDTKMSIEQKIDTFVAVAEVYRDRCNVAFLELIVKSYKEGQELFPDEKITLEDSIARWVASVVSTEEKNSRRAKLLMEALEESVEESKGDKE